MEGGVVSHHGGVRGGVYSRIARGGGRGNSSIQWVTRMVKYANFWKRGLH